MRSHRFARLSAGAAAVRPVTGGVSPTAPADGVPTLTSRVA